MWLDLQPWLPLLTISLTITLCFLAGIALGLRYKVLILVPAVTLAMIFAMIIGVARADHFWSVVLAMVVLGTAVQFGYLAGIAIRAAVGSVIPLPHAQVAQGHPRKKPAAPSLKLRLSRTPLEQRSGSEPLEPSAKGRLRGQRSKSAAERSK
jgi:hypothetical protein